MTKLNIIRAHDSMAAVSVQCLGPDWGKKLLAPAMWLVAGGEQLPGTGEDRPESHMWITPLQIYSFCSAADQTHSLQTTDNADTLTLKFRAGVVRQNVAS